MKSLLLPMIGLTLFAGCAPRTDEAAQAAVAPAAATALEEGRAKLYVVMGQVRKETSGGWVNTGRGTDFVAGDAIVTGDDGNALLVFTNGARLLVRPNTELLIEQISFAPFDQFARGTFLRLKADPSRSVVALRLVRGTLSGQALEPHRGSSFAITTAAGEVAVRGGVFHVGVSANPADGGTTVTVGNAVGQLAFTATSGRATVIPAGTKLEATATGPAVQAPRAPVRISELRCFYPESGDVIREIFDLLNSYFEHSTTPGSPPLNFIPPTPAPCPLKQ